MKKIVLVALALAVAFVAVPAFASVQNVKVYGNLDVTGVYRANFTLGNETTSPRDSHEQNTIISQTRLGIDADLTDNVSVTVGLINERAWNADTGTAGFAGNSNSTNDTDVDIYLAFATLREMLYSPLTVVIGRQQWKYGNGLVFDATGANNVAPTDSGLYEVAEDLTYQTALDAIRAILDYNPLTIEFFFALTNQGDDPEITGALANQRWEEHLKGVNVSYNLGDEMDSVIESYFIEKRISTPTGAEDTKTGLKVVGLRGSTNPIEGLNLQAEFAKQIGHTDSSVSNADNYQGYIMQGIVNYKLPVLEEYNPVVNYTFTKATGDDESGDGDISAWQPFYESQGAGTIYNQLFNLTNLIIHSASLETTPIEDVTAKFTWNGLWREDDDDSLTVNNPYSTTEQSGHFTKAKETEVGQEIDLGLSYAYTEDVTIGTNLGWFFPGKYFESYNDTAAKQALVSLGVKF